MMGEAESLRLQAWIDGELPVREAAEVQAWVAADAGAAALAAELRATRALVRGSESVRLVPESREFYWSKIRRGIEREERAECRVAPAEVGDPRSWWQRWLVPAAAVAAVVFVFLALTGLGRHSAQLAVAHEIETPLEQMSSITFRSERARMTVVWVNYEIR